MHTAYTLHIGIGIRPRVHTHLYTQNNYNTQKVQIHNVHSKITNLKGKKYIHNLQPRMTNLTNKLHSFSTSKLCLKWLWCTIIVFSQNKFFFWSQSISKRHFQVFLSMFFFTFGCQIRIVTTHLRHKFKAIKFKNARKFPKHWCSGFFKVRKNACLTWGVFPLWPPNPVNWGL